MRPLQYLQIGGFEDFEFDPISSDGWIEHKYLEQWLSFLLVWDEKEEIAVMSIV